MKSKFYGFTRSDILYKLGVPYCRRRRSNVLSLVVLIFGTKGFRC